VFANNYAMTRDPEVYGLDPDTFRPERFLAPVDAETRRRMDPRSLVFGFGRRYAFPLFFLLHSNRYSRSGPETSRAGAAPART
jgi:hypothetical protein